MVYLVFMSSVALLIVSARFEHPPLSFILTQTIPERYARAKYRLKTRKPL